MNEDGPQNLVPVFIFEIVFETSVEKGPKKFGPFYCTWFEFVSSEWKWPAKFGPCFSIWNCFWDKCRKMAQEIWSLILHLFYVWNKCIKMAHKIWSTLVHGGIFETSVKTWPIEFGPHFCTCLDFKISVKNGLQHTFVLVLLLKQMYENGPQILVHTFEVEWVYETIVEKMAQ